MHWRTINGRDSLFFHVNTRPTHMWKFLQRKRWRTDFLKIFDSRCFNSLYICAHSCMQRRHIEEQSRALPEMYLFSMGQFLCVVMTMIDCKQTRKTDLQQFTCAFVRQRKQPWIYYIPLLLQSYNCISIGKSHRALKQSCPTPANQTMDICIILQVLNPLSVPRRIFSSTPFLGYPVIYFIIHSYFP